MVDTGSVVRGRVPGFFVLRLLALSVTLNTTGFGANFHWWLRSKPSREVFVHSDNHATVRAQTILVACLIRVWFGFTGISGMRGVVESGILVVSTFEAGHLDSRVTLVAWLEGRHNPSVFGTPCSDGIPFGYASVDERAKPSLGA